MPCSFVHLVPLLLAINANGLAPMIHVLDTAVRMKRRSAARPCVASDGDDKPVEITFVTGNLRKLIEAQMIIDSSCDIPFHLVARGDLDLDEYQSETPEKIAAAKCRLAARVVGGPVMIDDTSLCFEALGGLPGPYIKWFMDGCGCDGLVRMLNGFEGANARVAYAQCSIAFSPGPGAEPCVFTGRTRGSIATSYSEEAAERLEGFGWDAIFIPESAVSDTFFGSLAMDERIGRVSGGGDNTRTFGEMSTEEKNGISHRGRALRQFSVFLKENEDWVLGRALKRRAVPESPDMPGDVYSFRRRRRMV